MKKDEAAEAEVEWLVLKIKTLIQKSADSSDATEALKYSQASLNVANAALTIVNAW